MSDPLKRLDATSTTYTEPDGTVYSWKGLTVSPVLTGDGRIDFTDNSFINLRTGRVFVATNGATVTAEKDGKTVATHTCVIGQAGSTTAIAYDGALQVVQGSGTMFAIFGPH